MRLLRKDEVEFRLEIEPEETAVRGNFMATEDPEQDKRDEDEIIARLNRGDDWAWCLVIVKGYWQTFSASSALGGCSYANEADFKREGSYDDMCDEILDLLNAEIQNTATILESLKDPERWPNPWAREVVYVPIEELAACVDGLGQHCVNAKGERFVMTVETTLAHWRQKGPGERLDAYILPQADVYHPIGIRYGAEPSEYLSPGGDRVKVAALLAKYQKTK